MDEITLAAMLTQTSFNYAIRKDGVVLEKADMSMDERSRADHIESMFALYQQALIESVPKLAVGWAKSLMLKWVDNPAINAYAFANREACYVGLYRGVIDRLWFGYLALMRHPVFFRHDDDPVEDYSLTPDEVHKMIQAIIVDDALTDEHRQKLHTFYLKDNKRVERANRLYVQTVVFLFMHEIHHFWCGHIFMTEKLKESGLSTSGLYAGAILNAEIRKALEIHADQFAIERSLHFSTLLYEDERELCTEWLLALTVLSIMIDPRPPEYLEWEDTEHPHPHARWVHLMVAAKKYMEILFNITENDWRENLFKVVTDNLIVLNRICEKSFAVPFEEADKYGKRSDSDLDRYLLIIKSMMQTFQDANDQMCLAYNQ